jgi:hypothetical protein
MNNVRKSEEKKKRSTSKIGAREEQIIPGLLRDFFILIEPQGGFW